MSVRELSAKLLRFVRRHKNSSAAIADESELQLFFGRNSELYLSHYHRLRKSGRRISRSWNWPAFFTGYVWLIYRRFYSLGILLLVISVMPLILALFQIKIHVALGVSISMAMLSKSLYVRHALRQIRIADKRKLAGAERVAYLMRRGGTSPMAGALAGIVLAVQIVLGVAVILTRQAEDAHASLAPKAQTSPPQGSASP